MATKSPPTASSSRLSLQDTINLDFIIRILSSTIFHPFIAALIPLCLRAQAISFFDPALIITSVFAALVSAYHAFFLLDHWLAYGSAREMKWTREVVVITGGKGGLGAVLAEILAMKGVGVAVLDASVTDKEQDGEEEGERAPKYYRCDVGHAQEMEKVWTKVVDDLGTPTILINNAAIAAPASVLSQTPEEVSRLFAVNTISHFTLSRLFLRTLLSSPSSSNSKKGGHIVTVSSVLGHMGAANLSAYTASKAALMAYHASLKAELRGPAPEVKTILVAQGQLDTEMFREVRVRGWLQRFLGPVIGAREVAMEIVKMLDRGQGGEVRMPAYTAMIGWLLVLPSGVARLLRDFSGADVVVDVGDRGLIVPDGSKSNGKTEKSVAYDEESDDDDDE